MKKTKCIFAPTSHEGEAGMDFLSSAQSLHHPQFSSALEVKSCEVLNTNKPYWIQHDLMLHLLGFGPKAPMKISYMKGRIHTL